MRIVQVFVHNNQFHFFINRFSLSIFFHFFFSSVISLLPFNQRRNLFFSVFFFRNIRFHNSHRAHKHTFWLLRNLGRNDLMLTQRLLCTLARSLHRNLINKRESTEWLNRKSREWKTKNRDSLLIFFLKTTQFFFQHISALTFYAHRSFFAFMSLAMRACVCFLCLFLCELFM